MEGIPWEIALAVAGVVVPICAALWEFVFVGRKRLGYRVQMDTTATEAVHSEHAGALNRLEEEAGRPLDQPSFVLLRIENNGSTHIDSDDYATLPDDRVGLRIEFPGRKVAGMVVTELSHRYLEGCFGPDSGLGVRDGLIELPKVPLNRNTHYKVLAALEREGDGPSGPPPREFPKPEVVGGITGGAGSGGLKETRSHTGVSRPAIALICFLMVVVVGQFGVSLADEDAAPLDCATGDLTVVGSTAFAPVLREAAAAYHGTCPDAGIDVRTEGSSEGLMELDAAGESRSDALLAFTDGAKDGDFPRLLPRPIAFSLFTLVVNSAAGVQELSLDDVRRIYAGEVRTWSELGGNDVPVRLVSREPGSGTRKTFEQRALDGRWDGNVNSLDCLEVGEGAEPGVVRCQRDSTSEVLDTVASTPGLLGYSEAGATAGRDDLLRVWIDGHEATLEAADQGAYPLWQTEYAYTYGEPAADSVAASFLRYLTNEVGRDIVRSHGHRPCAELRNPVLCQPT
ncbi:substrate-binding domain-containing protein [Streptomyces sp. B6B3]|uniref:PstS family phosphate ABC transporter substrate-binding protein n=1 Tax=Streptomyces sp. B6B3 TaxID=3153570 RepID=UPI00325F29E2